jgi:hypothetical protein
MKELKNRIMPEELISLPGDIKAPDLTKEEIEFCRLIRDNHNRKLKLSPRDAN